MTATFYSGMRRHSRRRSGRSARFHWKKHAFYLCVFAVGGFFVLNGIYQVIRKPGEILAPVSASFAKRPESTWRNYGSLFEKHSTGTISPEFLAALAQVESDGNPIARTYWRWQWSWNPLEIYRPASSALGMFQFTDGTFAEARRYCVRNHEVIADGPWYDFRSCWFNSFYTRTIASHSIEMTAAYLHRSTEEILASRSGKGKLSAVQKERLAALIHLCGAKRGEIFARRGFRLVAGERCGTHGLRRYLVKVDRMEKRFEQLRRAAGPSEGGRNPLASAAG